VPVVVVRLAVLVTLAVLACALVPWLILRRHLSLAQP
jgi:hypothetical protein